MSEETATKVTDMMTQVASIGTAAGLTTSVGTLAGKTGTAETNIEQRLNQPWLIAFAPAEDPQIAVAATLEPCMGCFGGHRCRAGGHGRRWTHSADEAPSRTAIGDRYTLIQRVGSGGMADVWSADDSMLGRVVALKFLHERFGADEQFVERFRREAQVGGRASAPERRLRLRPRGSRRPPLHRDGVRAGSLAEGSDRPRALARRGGRDRPPDPRRREVRPRAGDRPPRPEAAQRPR